MTTTRPLSFVQNLNELKALATDWTNDADVQRLRQLDAAYTAWAPIPRTLFELHDNPIENQPALRLENTEFRPVANVWAAQLATLIQLQEERSVTPEQRALLTNLIDLQTSFQGMVTNLRAYAITGDVGFKYGYADNLVANGQVFAQINTRRDIMSPEQRGILDKMTADRAPLLALPLDIFAAREGNQSVRDLYLFRTETEPLAATMLSILDEITTAQRAYLQADLDGSRRSLTRMQYQTLFGGLLALGLGAVMALFLRSTIVGPVERLDDTAKRIQGGDLHAQAVAESGDEIGRFALTFNSMTDRLRLTIGRLEQLYAMSRGIMTADSLSDLIGVVVQGGNLPVINRAVLNLFTYDDTGSVDGMVVHANWYSGSGTPPSPIGTHYPRTVNAIIDLFLSHDPVVFDHVALDPRTDPATAAVARQLGIAAMMVLPLWSLRPKPLRKCPRRIHKGVRFG